MKDIRAYATEVSRLELAGAIHRLMQYGYSKEDIELLFRSAMSVAEIKREKEKRANGG